LLFRRPQHFFDVTRATVKSAIGSAPAENCDEWQTIPVAPVGASSHEPVFTSGSWLFSFYCFFMKKVCISTQAFVAIDVVEYIFTAKSLREACFANGYLVFKSSCGLSSVSCLNFCCYCRTKKRDSENLS
jgi:hypothetical protein